MVSAGVHRPKNTSLSHCFHVASKHVVKSENWGRMIFINVQRQAPCILLFRLEISCFLCCLQFKGTNIVLTGLCLAACSTKKYLFGYPQVCLPSFFKFCSWIHWADAVLDYVYASHLFGRVNQILYESLGLGSWWGGTDTWGEISAAENRN